MVRYGWRPDEQQPACEADPPAPTELPCHTGDLDSRGATLTVSDISTHRCISSCSTSAINGLAHRGMRVRPPTRPGHLRRRALRDVDYHREVHFPEVALGRAAGSRCGQNQRHLRRCALGLCADSDGKFSLAARARCTSMSTSIGSADEASNRYLPTRAQSRRCRQNQ